MPAADCPLDNVHTLQPRNRLGLGDDVGPGVDVYCVWCACNGSHLEPWPSVPLAFHPHESTSPLSSMIIVERLPAICGALCECCLSAMTVGAPVGLWKTRVP